MILAHNLDREGSPPPIVLLHSLALDRSMWQPMAEEIDDGRAVISLDLRGHGGSPKDDAFSIDDMADDVAETLGELGQAPATIVGLSMGGCVAQALAIRHPGLVRALGLIDTTAWYGPDAPEKWAERASKARKQGMTSLSQFQLDRWFSTGFIRDNQELTEHLLRVFAANDIDCYTAACHAMGDFDARAALGTISVPAVVIVGELDPATTPEHASEIAARIPDSMLHVLPGAKHLTPVEYPRRVADLLRPLWKDEADTTLD